MKFRFNKKYALFFIGLLAAELSIAFFVKNPLIRDNIGDLLVVALLYCFLLTFFEVNKVRAIIGVWVFALLVEISQAYHLIEILNMQDSKLAQLILGTTFDFNDILSYTAGCVILYILEFSEDNSRPRKINFPGF